MDLAPEVTAVFYDLVARMKTHFKDRVVKHGLTPVQAHALFNLEPGRSIPARALAERLAIDPGNLTSILDVLHARGLIDRRPGQSDKRYKLVSLTAAGEATRVELGREVHSDLPLLAGLSSAEAAELHRLLVKASQSAAGAH